MTTTVYLASTSSYRQELLKKILTNFEVMDSGFQEEKLKTEVSFHGPKKLSLLLAKGKALAAMERLGHRKCCIIASDQVCALGDQLLSKPGQVAKAQEQLLSLQGRVHHLHTSVCVIDDQSIKAWTVTSTLHMRTLSAAQIKSYLKQDRPYHCAGSYKIEEHGIGLFEKIQTPDYFSIIGLPLMSLGKYLREKSIIR